MMNLIAASLLTATLVPTLSTPADAAALALADARQFADPRPLRYIWIRAKDNVNDDIRVVSYAMNLINRTPLKYRPVPIANDKTVVLRIDTRLFSPVKEIDSFLNTWEDLKYDPKFSGLITQGSLKLAKLDPVGDSVSINFRAEGIAFRKTETAKDVLKRDGVLRYRPPHVGQAWDELSAILKTEAPVIEHHYFIYRSMHAIKDKDRPLFSKVFGGLYYDFAGIPGGKKNDLDDLLETLGVGGRGKTAKQIFEALRSDQRAAMFRSNVTGRMRRVEILKTLAGREGQGIFALTSDFGAADIDIDQSPIANLLEVNKIKAHEAIWERPNGLHAFSLYNGQFQRQDSAPDDVVSDTTIPAPHSRRLQPAISCIRCHGKEDGWQPVTNDVKTMLASKRVDIFGDLSRSNQQDAIDRIAGLYLGDFSTIFRRGRDDYAVNIMATTGPWSGKDQLDIVKYVAKHMDNIVSRYWYDTIGPKEAMAEMGHEVDEKDAANAFAAYVLKIGNHLVLEDSRVAALRASIRIGRPEFDLVFSFVVK